MSAKDAERQYLRALGRALRAEREAKGVSQETLALKVRIDRTYISGIERGVRSPSVQVLLRIAWGLGAKPSELFAAAEATKS